MCVLIFDSQMIVWCLCFGVAFGLVRFVLEIVASVCGVSILAPIFVEMNFLHFSALNFFLCTLVLLVASHLTRSNEDKDPSRFLWKPGLYATLRREGILKERKREEGFANLEMVSLRPKGEMDSSSGAEGGGGPSAEEEEKEVERMVRSSARWGWVVDCAAVVVLCLFAAVLVYFK